VTAQEQSVLSFIEASAWRRDGGDAAFGALAIESFRAQCDAIPAFGAFARHLGRGPGDIRSWRDIPPVPASAFKSHDLSAATPGRGAVVFETSGTTISRPGRVRLGSTRPYEASLLRSFERHLLPDGARLPILVFGPTRDEAPRSSLWFMADCVARAFGTGRATATVQEGTPRWDLADRALARAVAERRPVLLFGTTLLFAAYFERCDARGLSFALPPGSRAMDTGGAKGARVEVGRAAVHAMFERVLGIPSTHVVNEYGMAELGSQFYEDRLLANHEGRVGAEGHRGPPWARTRVLDPETLAELGDGEPGILVHVDLANLEVPLAVQTEDVGVREGDRLFLRGRLPEAERRGCSLPFEEFLERERPEAR
jgi:hypothetical protein